MIQPNEIPRGKTPEAIAKRNKIIKDFFKEWKKTHPENAVYNYSLDDKIYVQRVSVVETAYNASISYLSTLAVLQLDSILTFATAERTLKTISKTQEKFDYMYEMYQELEGIGQVKLLVGVNKLTKQKVQYSLTAIEPL